MRAWLLGQKSPPGRLEATIRCRRRSHSSSPACFGAQWRETRAHVQELCQARQGPLRLRYTLRGTVLPCRLWPGRQGRHRFSGQNEWVEQVLLNPLAIGAGLPSRLLTPDHSRSRLRWRPVVDVNPARQGSWTSPDASSSTHSSRVPSVLSCQVAQPRRGGDTLTFSRSLGRRRRLRRLGDRRWLWLGWGWQWVRPGRRRGGRQWLFHRNPPSCLLEPLLQGQCHDLSSLSPPLVLWSPLPPLLAVGTGHAASP